MLAGHRWERDNVMLVFRCVPLPVGGVESYQWCVGCNSTITDLELFNSKLPVDDEFFNISLDMLARAKGHKPIEAGTIEEWRLRK